MLAQTQEKGGGSLPKLWSSPCPLQWGIGSKDVQEQCAARPTAVPSYLDVASQTSQADALPQVQAEGGRRLCLALFAGSLQLFRTAAGALQCPQFQHLLCAAATVLPVAQFAGCHQSACPWPVKR